MSVYSSDVFLPIGFCTDSFISEDDFYDLSVPAREKAVQRGIVLKEESVQKLPETYSRIIFPEFGADEETNEGPEEESLPMEGSDVSSDEIPFSVECEGGVSWEDGQVTVTDTGGRLVLRTESISGTGLYLLLEGLHFEGTDPFDLFTKEELEEMDSLALAAEKRKSALWKEPTNTNISVSFGSSGNTLSYRTDQDNYYCGRDNFILHLLKTEDEQTAVTIRFSQPGLYKMKDLKLYAAPVPDTEKIEDLRRNIMEGTSVGVNRITGKVSSDKAAFLCLQIPYSRGWRAYLDGKEKEILQADIMFMAVSMEPGEHDVELRYSTPLLREGAALSAAGLVVLLLYGILRTVSEDQKKRKQH